MKVQYINLTTTDPSFNLATEEYVFSSLPKDRSYFMLWQNDNAIIIGKYQNTLAEINKQYVDEHNIKVVRRLSGGGAVYHDLGNLNFTIITDAGETSTLDLKLFCFPVMNALKKMGINAELSGRNDMLIDGKKFSGNSQYLKNGRVMHHGTIIFNSNLSVLQNALKVDPGKILSKGIKSVRSRVANLCEYMPKGKTLENFRAELLKSFIEENPGDEYIFTKNDLEEINKLAKERYATYEWNYGFSPECTLIKEKRIDGVGQICAFIKIEKGVISDIKFLGDFFSTYDPSEIENLFIGKKPEAEDYKNILSKIDINKYFSNITSEQFLDILR